MHITTIAEAQASLAELVNKVLQGEEVIIGQAGKPVAKLVPYDLDHSPRDLNQGIWRDKVWMADDFDRLPEDILRAFTGESDDALTP